MHSGHETLQRHWQPKPSAIGVNVMNTFVLVLHVFISRTHTPSYVRCAHTCSPLFRFVCFHSSGCMKFKCCCVCFVDLSVSGIFWILSGLVRYFVFFGVPSFSQAHSFPPSSLDRRFAELSVSPKKVVGCRGWGRYVEVEAT